MLAFACDENLNHAIVRGLLRRKPEINIVRIQDAGLCGSDDPTVLEWAASEGRILLTHDVTTLPDMPVNASKPENRWRGCFKSAIPHHWGL